MTKLFNKFKNPPFVSSLAHSPQFLDNFFSSKIRPCPAQRHIALSSPMPKFRKNWSDSKKTSAWTDGRTGRPYFIRPFRLPPGFHKKGAFLILLKITLLTESVTGLEFTSSTRWLKRWIFNLTMLSST